MIFEQEIVAKRRCFLDPLLLPIQRAVIIYLCLFVDLDSGQIFKSTSGASYRPSG